jgi:hypothetical protein
MSLFNSLGLLRPLCVELDKSRKLREHKCKRLHDLHGSLFFPLALAFDWPPPITLRHVCARIPMACLSSRKRQCQRCRHANVKMHLMQKSSRRMHETRNSGLTNTYQTVSSNLILWLPRSNCVSALASVS